MNRYPPKLSILMAFQAKGQKVAKLISGFIISVKGVGWNDMVNVQVSAFLGYLAAMLASMVIPFESLASLAFPVEAIFSLTTLAAGE